MDDGPFASHSAFRAAFEARLLGLLEEEGLGPFILACANLSYDPGLFVRARPRLGSRFAELGDRLRSALRSGRPVREAGDDLLVFLKLLAVGFDHVRPTEVRSVGPWEVQFNPLRAFRPARAAGGAPRGIRAEFNPHGFHFNRRFLEREVLWSGDLAGRAVTLLYNKYPFVDLHGLLVPDCAAHRPQFLTRADHDYAWRIAWALADRLPGVGLGYNAYGAFASVNHLHLQLFVRDRPLPAEALDWAHNGGETPYPARCEAFGEVEAAWRRLDALHELEEPYNLLYRPGRLYLWPRLRQGTYTPAPWATGHAWYEMAGGATVFTRDDYERLDADAIRGELARTSGIAPGWTVSPGLHADGPS